MHFARRIYGIENEFGVMLKNPKGLYINHSNGGLKDIINLQQIEQSVLLYATTEYQHLWHSNGSNTYIDTGDHPEHATPECASVHEVVLYSKAGEKLINRVFDHSSTGLLLFKNNMGYDNDLPGFDDTCGQYGCHENYLFNYHDCARTMEELRPLLGMLATRQIFDGAGSWRKNGEFHLSQRAGSMRTDVGYSSSTDRSFLQLKTGDTGRDLRLHIVSGDANICEFATYLKIGTMSLVLSLFESGCFPDAICTNPIEAIRTISRSADPNIRSVKIQDNSYISALAMQTMLFETLYNQLPAATYADEEIEYEVKKIMHCWEQALNAIANNDHEWMQGRLDYATKQYLAEQHIARQKISDPEKMLDIRKTIDVLYHGISDPTLHRRMNTKWHDRRILTNAEIEDAISHPPRCTRARMRGIFVSALKKHAHSTPTIGWPHLGFCKNETYYKLELPLANVSHMPEFDSFLAILQEE